MPALEAAHTRTVVRLLPTRVKGFSPLRNPRTAAAAVPEARFERWGGACAPDPLGIFILLRHLTFTQQRHKAPTAFDSQND